MKWWLILQCSVLKVAGICVLFGADYILFGWLLFFGGGAVVLAHIFLPRAQGLCDVVTSFQPMGKEVWLTIDDGPDPEDTPAILEALAVHHAKATFFMIGEKAELHPEWVDQVLAAGHTIGTHTHSHPVRAFWIAGSSQVRRELDRSLELLNREGHTIRLFRSPVGIKNFFLRRALFERSLQCVAWTIRSGDALGRSPGDAANRVESELRPGAIILMHEGAQMDPAVRVEAIRKVLKTLSVNGFRCVLPERDRWIF